MIINVHLVSKHVAEFSLDHASSEALIRAIKPKEIFQRPVHQFLGKAKMVSVQPGLIEWIDFETDYRAKNKTFSGTPVVRQLSPATFKKRVTDCAMQLARVQEMDKPPSLLLAFGMATFRSGETLYIEYEAAMSRGEDRAPVSLKIFSLPALFVEKEDGGLLLMNPANIVIWQVVPGLKKSGIFSVPGELKQIRVKS